MENFFAAVGQELTDEQLGQVTGGSGPADFAASLVPQQYRSSVTSALSQTNGVPASANLGGLLGQAGSSSPLTGLLASSPSGFGALFFPAAGN